MRSSAMRARASQCLAWNNLKKKLYTRRLLYVVFLVDESGKVSLIYYDIVIFLILEDMFF